VNKISENDAVNLLNSIDCFELIGNFEDVNKVINAMQSNNVTIQIAVEKVIRCWIEKNFIKEDKPIKISKELIKNISFCV